MNECTVPPSDRTGGWKPGLWTFLLIIIMIPMVPSVDLAQVTTSITSSGLNTQVDHAGNSYNITGGTRPGNGPNLFHSFGNFDVGGGDIANFLNNTGLPTSNILGRVTGGNISNIYGTIQTTGFGHANLFLMNPSGIVLGPGASLNVGGSIGLTTSQYIRLFDGVHSGHFYANPANDGLANSILTINASAFEFLSASPAAYGFLTAPDPNATITVQGSLLKVPEGQSLSLAGGNITVQSDILPDGTSQGANLQAPGGRINLVSVASPGETLLSNFQPAPNINGASFTTMGTVTLKEGATLNVSGQLDEFGTPIGKGNGGTVLVRGGRLVMDASAIVAFTFGAVDGARTAVDIQVAQDVALSNSAAISVGTSLGSGLGGDVVITAKDVSLSELSGIATTTSGQKSGGDVFLNVGSLRLLSGSNLSTNTGGLDLDGDGVTDVFGGRGGNITIQGLQREGTVADSVLLSGGSGITSNTAAEGNAGGGDVSIAARLLNLDEASFIRSSTSAIAIDLNGDGVVDLSGRGGDIVLNVQQLRVAAGATITSSTGFNAEGAADGGSITVQGLSGPGNKASSALLSGQGTGIVSDSSFGQAGEVIINAGTLTITDGAAIAAGTPSSLGPAGKVTLTADSIVIAKDGLIFSRSFAKDSGQVTITAKELTLDKGSIVTNTSSDDGGRGGDVVITGGKMNLRNGARITSESDLFSTGRAGDITMNVSSLNLNSGSRISSASLRTAPLVKTDGTTEPPGRAGTITITASGDVTSNASTITTSAQANRGGDISITAGRIQLSDGTQINANSAGPLTVTKLVLDANGQLLKQVVGDGNAGNVTLNSKSTVLIQNSSITTEASRASGGQITINAPNLIQLVDSQVSTSVAGATGDTKGGNISIDPEFVVLKGSQILAQAFAGNGGGIDITSGLFLADAFSLVDASSTLGVSGTVQINSPINNLSSVVARLSESLQEVQALLRASCAARLSEGATSSFVERGRDGIPAGPDSLLASPYLPTTVSQSSQWHPSALAGISRIAPQRLFGRGLPSSSTLFSDRATCSP